MALRRRCAAEELRCGRAAVQGATKEELRKSCEGGAPLRKIEAASSAVSVVRHCLPFELRICKLRISKGT